MNLTRARELRAEGICWELVGVRLALEEGRASVYHPASVQQAVRQDNLRRGTFEDGDDEDYRAQSVPHVGGADPLLARLREVHGEPRT